MFVTLSKILPVFIYPVGLISLALIAVIVFHRYPRWRNLFAGLGLAVILLSGNAWSALALVRSLEWRYFPPAEVPQVEAIVVLGGGTEPDLYPRTGVEINGAGDRLLTAARLFKQGKAPYILTSGGGISWMDSRTISAAEEMASILNEMGVPQTAIWEQKLSQNTYEDALYCRQVLEEKGIHKILLVTSALHMPRSVALFEKQGFEVIPYPSDFNVTEADWQKLFELSPVQILNLVPNVKNISLVSSALKEYIGIVVYRLRGWL